MQVQKMMTSNPACVTPDDTIRDAARLMKEHDCGLIPVVDSEESKRLVGVVTDRDLAVRAIGEGKGADTKVSQVMSRDPSCASPDTDVSEVERIMSERQVRRVPVVDSKGRLAGIVAQADLALSDDKGVSDREVARTVERISQPSGSSRGESSAGTRVSP
ncbi:MAG TPA: CBS domain-containing protein [Gemmatimonadaceae bacterium]|jgi:CBS domain-containing protein|nr:CBS domain-containing protein [Gemmatimonadaceae bacterium]